MNKTVTALLVGLAVLALIALVTIVSGASAYNGLVNTRAQYNSVELTKETVYDNMWKEIAQTGEVTAKQQELIKSVIIGYAQARGPNSGGTMIGAVNEKIPEAFGTELSVNQQNIILSTREKWVALNNSATQLSVDFNKRLETLGWGMLYSHLNLFQPLTPKTISSTRTKDALKTGIDDDVHVYPTK